MKPDDQRIAIATACGWTNCRIETIFNSWPRGTDPKGNQDRMVPEYLTDLNAMYSALKSQNAEFLGKYDVEFCRMMHAQSVPAWSMTAKDWADCFIQTKANQEKTLK